MTERNGTAIAKRDESAAIIEQVIAQGDLDKLSPAQRVAYYREVCHSLGLNELTRPFDYLRLNNKLTLYANKGCTDQLRNINELSITQIDKEQIGELYVVTAYGQIGQRKDSEIGAVNVANLHGEPLANAMMKAVTKAKRRLTLSMCGLGMLDESEVETIPAAATVVVDSSTGEVLEERPARSPKTNTQLADEKAWDEWVKLCSEADAAGIEPPELSSPMGMVQLRSEYVKLRRAIKDKQGAAAPSQAAAQSSDGPEAPSPSSGPSDSADDVEF